MIYDLFNEALKYLIVAFLGGMLVWIKYQFKKLKALEDAVTALIHDAFFRYCRYVLSSGELTIDSLENLDNLYQSYKSLGLNGSGEKLYQECKALKLKVGD